MKKSTFRFLGYKVVNFNCSIDHSSERFNDENLEFNQTIRTGYNVSEEDDRFAEVLLGIDISTKCEIFDLHIDLRGRFLGSSEMTDYDFSELCKRNAPAILLPVARGIIASYTVQAGIKPIILSVMNLQKEETEQLPIKETE